MFKPKHTFESVTRQLIEGLTEGSLTYEEESQTENTTEEINLEINGFTEDFMENRGQPRHQQQREAPFD